MNYFKGQTKRFDKPKNERGITLVALIITIIILIILAAVTINALTHDDLADLAIKSTQDYQKAQSDEMNMLNEIDTMVKETLKNIEDGTIKPKPDPEEPDIPTPPDFSETIEIANSNIGKTVDYTPNGGSYSTTQDIDGTATECSGESSQTFQTSDITGTWSLWGVDDKNIYVIADNATTKKLTLSGVRGYNNGVTLLDNICDTCFTDKTTYPNMKGQSLKLENVLAVKSSSATNTNSNYGNTPFSYSFKYPFVWNQYEKAQADSIANRSTAYPLTTRDALTFTVLASPYSTYFNNNSMNTSSNWKNSGYFRMVMTPAQSATYWLSSRFVSPNGTTSSYCFFGLHSVDSNGIIPHDTCSYDSATPYTNTRSYAVRPLVSFPMADYALQNDSDTIKIVKRN